MVALPGAAAEPLEGRAVRDGSAAPAGHGDQARRRVGWGKLGFSIGKWEDHRKTIGKH